MSHRSGGVDLDEIDAGLALVADGGDHRIPAVGHDRQLFEAAIDGGA